MVNARMGAVIGVMFIFKFHISQRKRSQRTRSESVSAPLPLCFFPSLIVFYGPNDQRFHE